MFSYRLSFVCLSSCLLLLAGCDSGTQEQSFSQNVQVAAPITKIAPLKLHYIGITKSFRKVDIRARVDGILQQRFFNDGDLVKENELLYQIDEKPYQAQVLSYQGQVDKSTADLAYQEIQYHRYQDLVAKKSISKSEFDQQYASYLSAKGQLENAQGNLEQAKINLGYCRIHAPFTGIVGKNLVDPGNLVKNNENTNLLTIVQVSPIRVEFNPVAADLRYFAQYQQYKPFLVEVRIPEDKTMVWKSSIDFLNNEVNQATSTILMRTTVDNPDFILKPELFVDVWVTVDPKHQYTLVPAHLVKEVQNLFQLRVVDTSSHVQVRNITPGKVEGSNLIIEAGLKEGDRVMLDNLTLSPGTLIKTVVQQQSS